jgi:hypothetical protein
MAGEHRHLRAKGRWHRTEVTEATEEGLGLGRFAFGERLDLDEEWGQDRREAMEKMKTRFQDSSSSSQFCNS